MGQPHMLRQTYLVVVGMGLVCMPLEWKADYKPNKLHENSAQFSIVTFWRDNLHQMQVYQPLSGWKKLTMFLWYCSKWCTAVLFRGIHARREWCYKTTEISKIKWWLSVSKYGSHSYSPQIEQVQSAQLGFSSKLLMCCYTAFDYNLTMDKTENGHECNALKNLVY